MEQRYMVNLETYIFNLKRSRLAMRKIALHFPCSSQNNLSLKRNKEKTASIQVGVNNERRETKRKSLMSRDKKKGKKEDIRLFFPSTKRWFFNRRWDRIRGNNFPSRNFYRIAEFGKQALIDLEMIDRRNRDLWRILLRKEDDSGFFFV